MPNTPLQIILDAAPTDTYQSGQPVALLIKAETDLGYKAIVDGKYWGILYYNEVFQKLEKNQEVDGYIKRQRPDGKIDITIYQEGNRDAKTLGEFILERLVEAGGYLSLDSKTEPEIIYRLFGVSKKKFKIALGDLYKTNKILIAEDGIRLTSNSIQP